MLTPNFERLANRSVVFDIAISQVAVCAPSRDSLLTGLRPDTMGHYNFQQSYAGHKLFIEHLVSAGYKTAGFGKVRHWDGPDKSVWTETQFDGPIELLKKRDGSVKDGNKVMTWYEYQDWEWNSMRSSVMPDKKKPHDTFPDHVIASKASQQIREFAKGPNYWMTGIGFKMPHTSLHVPYEYWDMYRDKKHVWRAAIPEQRRFPQGAPPLAWRCCADESWKFVEDDGASRHTRTESLGNINVTLSQEMYVESMQGYSAAVSFVDAQLGRILDVMDELDLWRNTTVVLTADHGMHNGEKAIWEKWTLFDEATRVPLFIAHPSSPFTGTHVFNPVELVDIFPTVLDLVSAPHIRRIYADKHNKHGRSGSGGHRGVTETVLDVLTDVGVLRGKTEEQKKAQDHAQSLREPSGRSLAPLVVGHRYSLLSNLRGHGQKAHGGHHRGDISSGGKRFAPPFAISQSIRCARLDEAGTDLRVSLQRVPLKGGKESERWATGQTKIWLDCDLNADDKRVAEEVCIMGYSARSIAFRYTLWVHFDRRKRLPEWRRRGGMIFTEELYDHRAEELGGLTHFELVNMASEPSFHAILEEQRDQLLEWIRTEVFRFGDDPSYQQDMVAYFKERELNVTRANDALFAAVTAHVNAMKSSA